MKLSQCDCLEWQEGIKQIDSAQTMAYIHGARYTGKPFKFCPWCGKERHEVAE